MLLPWKGLEVCTFFPLFSLSLSLWWPVYDSSHEMGRRIILQIMLHKNLTRAYRNGNCTPGYHVRVEWLVDSSLYSILSYQRGTYWTIWIGISHQMLHQAHVTDQKRDNTEGILHSLSYKKDTDQTVSTDISNSDYQLAQEMQDHMRGILHSL